MATDPLAEVRAFMKSKENKCSIAIATRDPDIGETLRAALEADDIPHTAISGWLKSVGRSVSASTVSRHRTGQCRCGTISDIS